MKRRRKEEEISKKKRRKRKKIVQNFIITEPVDNQKNGAIFVQNIIINEERGKGDEGRWNKGLKGIGGVQEFFIKEQKSRFYRVR